jgi:hypothetical protein
VASLLSDESKRHAATCENGAEKSCGWKDMCIIEREDGRKTVREGKSWSEAINVAMLQSFILS